MHVCVYREMYFEHLAHGTVGPGKPKNLRVGQRHRGELMQLESRVGWEGELLPALGPQSFLLRPSPDWARPTHTVEGNLLYSKSTDLTFISSKKHLLGNIQMCLITQLLGIMV